MTTDDPYSRPTDPAKRHSAAITDGVDRAPARAMLKASGYAGEKVVLLNPTDLTTVGPLGDVTHDLLVKIGMNVEMVATDWGTVVQRRTSKETSESALTPPKASETPRTSSSASLIRPRSWPRPAQKSSRRGS